MKKLSDSFQSVIFNSIPVVGPQLEQYRKLFKSLSEVFENKEDDIQKEIKKVLKNLTETEEIVVKLKLHIDNQQKVLNKTLEEYERYKDLAAIEKENAQPLLKELNRVKNKGFTLGIFVNIVMIIIGFILSHFIRIWFPKFVF